MTEDSGVKKSKLPKAEVSRKALFRLFAGLFLVLGIAVVVLTSGDLIPFFTHDSAGMVRALWAQDLENITQNDSIPEGWLHLKEVHFQSLPTEEGLLKKTKPFIPTHSEGTYRLNVFFDQWNESETHARGIMIQYSLINLKNGNTEWELSRTLPLKN